jgi:hypothetical protein
MLSTLLLYGYGEFKTVTAEGAGAGVIGIHGSVPRSSGAGRPPPPDRIAEPGAPATRAFASNVVIKYLGQPSVESTIA